MQHIKLGMKYSKLGISYTRCLYCPHKILQTALHIHVLQLNAKRRNRLHIPSLTRAAFEFIHSAQNATQCI